MTRSIAGSGERSHSARRCRRNSASANTRTPAPPKERRREGSVPAGSGDASGGSDVLVEPEQVRRIVSALDLGKTSVRRVRVGLADPVGTLDLQEVRVD